MKLTLLNVTNDACLNNLSFFRRSFLFSSSCWAEVFTFNRPCCVHAYKNAKSNKFSNNLALNQCFPTSFSLWPSFTDNFCGDYYSIENQLILGNIFRYKPINCDILKCFTDLKELRGPLVGKLCHRTRRRERELFTKSLETSLIMFCVSLLFMIILSKSAVLCKFNWLKLYIFILIQKQENALANICCWNDKYLLAHHD